MRILITVFKAKYETGILVAVISLRGIGEAGALRKASKESGIRKGNKFSKNMLFHLCHSTS